MKNRKPFLILTLGIILIASAAVITMLITQKPSGSITVSSVDSAPSPSSAKSAEPVQFMEPEVALPAVPAPILYTKIGKCYLANGTKSVYIGVYKNPAGESESPETVLSENKRYLFYLDRFDIYKGYGTLMRVAADAFSEPITVAENACLAVPSNGGTRALYITDIKDGNGKLYLWDEKEGSKFIDDNVLPEHLVFSPHATCYCYIAHEDGEDRLFIKQGNESALIKALKIDSTATEDYGNDQFQNVIPGDEGKVLYSLLLTGLNGWPLCLYSDGKTETISTDARAEKLLGSIDNIIYAEQVSAGWKLYYKESGKQSVILSDNFKLADFTDQYVSDNGIVFFLGEENDESMAAVDMYEATIGGQKEFIAVSDFGGLWSPNNACVTYEREESFCVSRKTDKGWQEERLCAVTYDEEDNSSIESEFDTSGNYLYYYDSENDGPLYRYSTEDGNVKKIVNNARRLCVFGDTPYVINSKGNAYRVNGDGSIIQIGKKVKEIHETCGGVYLTDEESGGNIYFVTDGTDQSRSLGSCENISYPGGGIEYQAPLGEDKDAAAEILYNDSDYYLSTIENYNSLDPYLTLAEDITLAEKLLKCTDLEPEETDFLNKMLKSFRLYEQYESGNKDKKTEASNALTAATDAYKSYVYGLTEDDINNEDE